MTLEGDAVLPHAGTRYIEKVLKIEEKHGKNIYESWKIINRRMFISLKLQWINSKHVKFNGYLYLDSNMMVDGRWYVSPQQAKLEDSNDKLATTLPAAYTCNVPTSLQTLSCLLLEIIKTLKTTNYSTNKISWSLSLPLCDIAWAEECSNKATSSSEHQTAIQYNQNIRSTYKTIASSHNSLTKRIYYLRVGLFWSVNERMDSQPLLLIPHVV